MTQEEIIKEYGEPFIRLRYAMKPNQPCLCELFRTTGKYRYIRPLKLFEQYEEETGLWITLTKDEIMNRIRNHASSFGADYGVELVNAALTLPVITSITGLFRNAVGVDVLPPSCSRYIHLKNEILIWDDTDKDFRLVPFSPDYNSRNRIDREYNPEATCPRFIEQLLGPMLRDRDSLRLVQLYFGQCLLKENISQTFMILSGPASVGKSVLVNIIEGILGIENVTELQPKRLTNPFELVAYSQKSLLTAKDIENDALSANKINALKKMTGNGLLTGEQKHHNTRIFAKGNFNIIITGNGDLTLNYGSGRDAFKRRMIWIDCKVPEHFKRVEGFDKILLDEEGDGILAWAIEGARQLLGNGGIIDKGKAQDTAIEFLLDESAPVETFIKRCVRFAPDQSIPDQSIPSQDVVHQFYEFARHEKWNNSSVLALTQRQVEQRFQQTMMRVHPECRHSTNIKVPGTCKMARGYMHCKIVIPK